MKPPYPCGFGERLTGLTIAQILQQRQHSPWATPYGPQATVPLHPAVVYALEDSPVELGRCDQYGTVGHFVGRVSQWCGLEGRAGH